MKNTPPVPLSPVPLSPIDHLFTGDGGYPIQLFFEFSGRIDFARLKDAFVKTLPFFSPLSSQIAVNDDGRYEFRYRADSFQFAQKELGSAVGLEDTQAIRACFDSVETFPGEILTKVNVVYAPEKTYLAIAISHSIVDGYSFFYFLSAWAATFHGKPFLPPVHDRALLIPDRVAAESLPSTSESLFRDSGLVWASKRPPIREQKLAWQVYYFTRARLGELKREAKQTVSATLTDNDVLVAALGREILPDDGRTKLIACPVDYRRLFPRLNKAYFGNAVKVATFAVTSEQRKRSLGEFALMTRQAVDQMTPEAVERSLQALEGLRCHHGLASYQSIHVADPVDGFLVTNLSRAPLEAIDFGTGCATAIRSATPAPLTAMVVALQDGLGIIYNCPVK